MSKKSLFWKILTFMMMVALLMLPQTSFAGPPSYTLTTAVVGSGSVDPAGGSYAKNNIVTLTATADAGWTFDHWEGAAAGTDNPTTVRMGTDQHVIAVFSNGATPTPEPSPTPGPTSTPAPPGSDKEVVGYYIQWGLYQRDYFVKNIVDSGAADVLTTINYAFGGISDGDLKCTSVDEFADYNKALDATESVDGVADPTSAGTLRGNFNQLSKYKQMYPNTKILISLGGWTHSYNFSEAALPANRAAFVSSCIDMYIHGNFTPELSDSTIFDGIDIDWEYPANCGLTCDMRPEDTANFTALLAEFRSQLDAVDPNLLLTVALPAGSELHDDIELDQIHQYLDWVNVMTYDYHGSWEPTGPTNHHSPLYSSAADPTQKGSSHDSMQAYLAAGVPASKLNMGVPFYGRGWGSVPDVDNGLYQTAGRIPRGTWEKGFEDFEELEAYGYPSFWDPIAEAQWIYDGRSFWTYDDAASISNKMNYINNQNLGGVFFWELSGDDPSGTLIHAIEAGLP